MQLPEPLPRWFAVARLAGLTGAVACAALLAGAAAAVPAASQPSSAPASQPAADETVGGALARLRGIKPATRTAEERALLAGLEFAAAIGAKDGAKAAALIDAAGYQALPLRGALRQPPEFPIRPADFARLLAQARPHAVEARPGRGFRLETRLATEALFPAVGRWMLPADFALVVLPSDGAPPWLTEPACVVVRLRGTRASIPAGNLLETLPAE